MKRLVSVLLCVLGIGLVLLGLLFLMGSAGRTYRLGVAVVALAAGGGLAGVGLRLFRQADAASPHQLRAEILELARRQDGEISEAEVLSILGRRAEGAAAILEALVAERRCERRLRDGAAYYVFPELQPRLMVRRCEYCEAELPLSSDEITTCPSCGGTLKTRVERRSLSGGDAYRMDE